MGSNKEVGINNGIKKEMYFKDKILRQERTQIISEEKIEFRSEKVA